MSYLIDGHNLIPNFGLRLDRRMMKCKLIGILQEFCRLQRREAEVYFDGAPVGQARTQSGHRHRSFRSSRHNGGIPPSRTGSRNWGARRATGSWSVRIARSKTPHTRNAPTASHRISLRELINKSPKPGIKSNIDKICPSEEVDEWLKLFGRKELKK